jgi:hypothetical protein
MTFPAKGVTCCRVSLANLVVMAERKERQADVNPARKYQRSEVRIFKLRSKGGKGNLQ